MISALVAFGLSLLFGIGVASTVLGAIITYKTFYSDELSGVVIMGVGFTLLSLGLTFLHVVLL